MDKPFAIVAREILKRYDPIEFAIGYGSGVFPQAGHDGKRQLDFIFGVEDTKEWHRQHIEKNRGDYSGVIWVDTFLGMAFDLFGLNVDSHFIPWLQEKGAGIYYHPFVKHGEDRIKYGVISVDRIVNDLREWTTLYVAGRMHKPVKVLHWNDEIEGAAERNLEHALHTALLMLPNTFTEEALYMTIAGLSYTGDSRMAIGENPGKVGNIVSQDMGGFHNLYYPLLDAAQGVTMEGVVRQDDTAGWREHLYDSLPVSVRDNVRNVDFDAPMAMQRPLKRAIRKIVAASSTGQTLKGVVTAGLGRSLRYGLAKVGKRFS
jgi:mitochondrial translocator assembly and maintenance protein 41